MLSHLKNLIKELAPFPEGNIKEQSFGLKDALIIVAIITGTTILGELFHMAGFSDVTIITLYILAVQITAIRSSGRITNAVVSLICVIVFNFFFTNPKYTLLAYDPDYPVTFIVMFIVAFLAGTIADRLKNLARQSERTLFRTQILLDTSQLLGKAHEREEIAEVLGIQVHKLVERDVIVSIAGQKESGQSWYYPEDCQNSFSQGIEQSAADWTMRSGKKSGMTTSIYPAAQAIYYPLIQNGNIYGLIGIRTDQTPPDAFTENILYSIIGQCGLAMENVRTIKEKEEAALKAQNEKLRADLLRAISHDIRTPLTAISGNASILLSSEGGFDDKTRQQLYADIYDDSIWLVNLVENLLSVSRAINGTMQLRCTTELLDDVIEEALQHVDRHAKDHNVSFEKGSDMILASMDVHLIEQVIINLVNNAVKYTPSGSDIIIKAVKKGQTALVTVTDNGPGILPEDLPHLFEMFYNGRKNAADASKSLGIGLALCKSIVEAHGGRIFVSNVSPQGACFSFTIPSREVNLHEQ